LAALLFGEAVARGAHGRFEEEHHLADAHGVLGDAEVQGAVRGGSGALPACGDPVDDFVHGAGLLFQIALHLVEVVRQPGESVLRDVQIGVPHPEPPLVALFVRVLLRTGVHPSDRAPVDRRRESWRAGTTTKAQVADLGLRSKSE
jgi:hypothetical protein